MFRARYDRRMESPDITRPAAAAMLPPVREVHGERDSLSTFDRVTERPRTF